MSQKSRREMMLQSLIIGPNLKDINMISLFPFVRVMNSRMPHSALTKQDKTRE
jgi:hypothetical protein